MDANLLKRRLELVWWGFTLVAVLAILIPILLQTHSYPFYAANTVYIVVFITFSRYAFFLRHTFIAQMFWPKFIILAGGAIVTFILIMSLGDFSNYLKDQGLQTLVDHLPFERQYSVMRYIQGEMIFFGIGSAFSAIALSLRMLVSIYRMYNHGTV